MEKGLNQSELNIHYENLRDAEAQEELDALAVTLKQKINSPEGFTETLVIQPNGTIKLPTQENDSMVSLFAHQGAGSGENLMQLAFKVEKRHPELQFSFEKDIQGKWLKYTVKNKLK